MKLKITPPTNTDKRGRIKKINPRLASADTALEFKFNEITVRAFHRSFGFELLDNAEDHVEIIVTDGRRRQNRIQYFNRNRTISCCSCEEFIKDECRFCVHLAAVENVLRYPAHYRKQDKNYGKWCATFRARLIHIPASIKQFDQHYTFWDPYKSTFYTFGRNKPTKETTGTKTFKRLQRKKKQKMVKYLPEPNDKGLLTGVALYDYQQDVFRNMLIAQRAICSMIMGAGKANWINSKILTPSGWARMKDIKIGDFVIASSGRPTKVIGVYPQGKKSIYKVTFTDGSSAFCCDEHLWAVRTPRQKYCGSKYKVKPLKDFMHDLVDKKGNHKYHIPMVRPVAFTTRPIPLDPYALGLLLGDGGFSNKKAVSFCSIDDFIVRQLAERLPCPLLRVKIKKGSNKDYCITKAIPSRRANKLLQIIRDLDLSGKKSNQKFIPDTYKYNSIPIRLSVLQGLIDTNGFVDKIGKEVIFYTTSNQLACDVQEIVWSFGGQAVICNKQTSYTHKKKKRKDEPSFAVHISLPKEITPVLFPKKIERFKSQSKYEPTRYFKSVEYVGEKPAQCIAVEAEDQLYVTDDYIVTHNTLTTIACYAFIDKHKPNGNVSMLVIGPKSLRYQWGSEIERTCNKKVFQVEKPAHISAAMNEDIIVMTYQFLTRHVDKFAKRKYDIIIVDEIQYVRNSKTKTWKAISKLKSDFFFGLSGTVIENRMDDLYSIMEIINPGVLGPKWKFDEQFQELQIKSRAKWIYKGFKNLDKLKELLKDNVFSYDKLSLPPIQHHNVFVDIGRDQAVLHDEFYIKAKDLIAKSLNGPVSNYERLLVQALLLKSRQVSNTKELITKKREQPSQKVAKFLELTERICVQQNEKLVVFSDWVEMLKICDRFVKQKFTLKSAFFTGKQNSKQREKAVQDFQNDPDCMIFFASDAGGIGLDGLQLVSSNVIHVELPWNPAKLDQRTGRVYRLQQKNAVNIYYLISKDTIEEKIFSLIQEKKQVRVQTLAEFHI